MSIGNVKVTFVGPEVVVDAETDLSPCAVCQRCRGRSDPCTSVNTSLQTVREALNTPLYNPSRQLGSQNYPASRGTDNSCRKRENEFI